MNVIFRLILLIALALSVTGCGSACACAATPSPQPTATLPPDVFELGPVRFATAEEGAKAIPKLTAIRAASRAGYDYGEPGAYLVIMTLGSSAHPDTNPVVDRLIWLLRWDNLEIDAPAPIGQDGTIPLYNPYTRAFVGVDAVAGTVRFSELRD